MRPTIVIGYLFILLLLGTSCSRAKQEEALQPAVTSPESSDNTQIYQAAGIVKSIPSNKKLIIIDHGEIPGFMRAMTMPFKVLDSAMIQRLKPQDSVHMILSYDGSEIILKEIYLIRED